MYYLTKNHTEYFYFLSNNKHDNICNKYAVDTICAISFLTYFFLERETMDNNVKMFSV